MEQLKENFMNRTVYVYIGITAILSLIYAVLVPPFALHFTDGISIGSVILLFLGILNIWWKDGFFSFFTWKKEQGPYAEYRNKLRQERRNAENPALYAGIALLAAALVLTGLYVVIR